MESSIRRLSLHIRPSRFFVLSLKHVLLSILSLGWYRFFTKTEIRKYVWSNIRLDNEAFEYTGTGKELLIGFLKALGFAAIVYPCFLLLTWLSSGAYLVVLWSAFIFGVYLLTQVVTFGALRYRLTRTTFRGVRFDLVGKASDFAIMSFLNFLLVLLTFGFYAPIARVKKAQFIFNNMRYGNQPFHFDNTGEPPYSSFVWAYFLTLPTLGLSWFWYSAAMTKHIVGKVSIGSMQLGCNGLSGGKLLRFSLSNMALVLCSFGVLYPLAALRSLRFFCEETQISGDLDFEKMRQTQNTATGTSEGMAELLELELG